MVGTSRSLQLIYPWYSVIFKILFQEIIKFNCSILCINYFSIRVFQAYENYSFEELRFAAPAVPRPSENMLVRCNSDGTYVANWTPSNIGLYNIHVNIDDFDTGTVYIQYIHNKFICILFSNSKEF